MMIQWRCLLETTSTSITRLKQTSQEREAAVDALETTSTSITKLKQLGGQAHE